MMAGPGFRWNRLGSGLAIRVDMNIDLKQRIERVRSALDADPDGILIGSIEPPALNNSPRF